MSTTFAVVPMARSQAWETARVLARAFIDDPIAAAIGPLRRGHRRLASPLSFMGILIASRRHGGTVRVARDEDDGRVLGVAVSFLPGMWPIPEGAAGWETGWLLVAGPAPLRRGLDFNRRIRAAHLREPHVYLWFLAVDPRAQSLGVGGTLLAAVQSDAAGEDVPVYLETGTMDNVSYYSARGYRTTGDLRLSTGEPLWLLERPASIR